MSSEETPVEESTVEEAPRSKFVRRFVWFGGLTYWILSWRLSSFPDSDVLTSGVMVFVAPIAYPVCAFFQLMSGHTDHSPDLTNWMVRFIWFMTLFLQLGTYWILGKLLQALGRAIQNFRQSYLHRPSNDDEPQA